MLSCSDNLSGGTIVRYDEFRDQLEAALERNSLHFHTLQRVETIELANTVRHWKACAHGAAPPSTEPFHVSAEIGFAWSPFDAARSYAREEDLLTELIGRKKRLPRTERRWTRVDLWLHARLPYGSTTAMPEPQLFGAWTASILEKIHGAFAEVEEKEGRIVAVLGAHEDVDVLAHCQPDGVVSLKGLAISGFRIVHLPRVWDDPDRRKAEKDPHAELDRVARTFKATLDEWTKSVSELAAWIRYSPPVAGAKPVEPWFEDLRKDDDNDGGPETIN
jgi:hypothetical protein